MEKKNLISIKATRTGCGINLYLKSPKIESWMRGSADGCLSDKEDFPPKWPYKYEIPFHQEMESFYHWGQDKLFLKKGKCNLSFLAAQGLSQGVNIELTGVFTDTMIQTFVECMKKELQGFYKEFLKSFSLDMVIYED